MPRLSLPNGVKKLLALVRWHGRPVGMVRLENNLAEIWPEQLQRAIEVQVQPFDKTLTIPTGPVQPVSVIVCTHERPEDLQRCLASLARWAAAGNEILVVDNGPASYQTAEVAAQYPVRYLSEPQRGLNRARNCGLMAATQPIVVYVDDDTVVDPHWLKALLEPFSTPEVAGVTGLVMPLELKTPAQEQFELYCWQRRLFQQKRFASPETRPAAAGVVGMGANMAFRRELLLSLGGFDPRLDAGTATCSGGDTDMFARVLAAGYQLVYNPAALVWHRHRREQAEVRRCVFGYGVGLYSFLTKRLLEGRDFQALNVAIRWFGGPLLKAAWRRLHGQPTVSIELLLLEAWGAYLGPWRFWQAGRMTKRPY